MRSHPRHHAHRLSAALAACLPLATLPWLAAGTAWAQPTTAHAELHEYHLPAQALEVSLRQFSRISGHQVVIDSAAAQGGRANALRGRFGAQEAIDRLLQGSGLVASRTGGSTFSIDRAEPGVLLTDPLLVQAPQEVAGQPAEGRFGGYYGLTPDQIAMRPGGDSNLTDQLRSHTRVQFSRAGRNSLQQGEIKPDNISLHGTRAYQTLFRLDGMAINSDIDPIDPGNGTVFAYNSGDTQGAYIDSRLVERIEVLDANISARHGGFSGGIVDATTRSWRGGTAGNVFVRMTDSGWNRTHVDDGVLLDSRNNRFGDPARHQPQYRKTDMGGWFETGLSETVGVVVGLSRRDADLPMIDVGGRYFEVDEAGELQAHERSDAWREQTRRSDNLNAKLSWYAAPHSTVHWSVFGSDYRETLFQNGVAHSGFTRDHDAVGTQLEWQHTLAAGALNLRAGWRSQRERRVSDRDNMVSYNDYSDWTRIASYLNGGIGNLDSRQHTTSLDAAFAFNPVEVGASTHRINVGAGSSQTRARTRRDRTYFNNSFDDYGWGPPMLRVDAFLAGQARAAYRNGHVYVEDDIQWGRLGLRPGLRAERDDFVGRTNLAPRLAADWALTGDRTQLLTAGINRYYGRSMLTWALYEAQNAGLVHCYFNCVPNTEAFGGTWVSTPDYEGMESLKTPYSDEWMVGWQGQGRGLTWELQVVDRRHRDEVRSQPKYPEAGPPRSSIREFINDSSGRSRNASLRLSHLQPLVWGSGEHELAASLAWQESRSDTALELGYTQLDLTRNLDRSRAWYRDRIIDARDLPTTDFNAPWKASLEWRAQWPSLGLTMSHLLSWQDGRTQPFRYGTGAGYATDPETGRLVARYDTATIASSARWDMRVGWRPAFARGLLLAVDVNNVLDSRNQIDVVGVGDTVQRVFEPGRQVWVSLGYDF